MATRAQLHATARAAAISTLAGSQANLSAAIVALVNAENSDPSTTISKPEVTAAANLLKTASVRLGVNAAAVKDFTEFFDPRYT